jgi:NADH-quinone oxidoreductase subunit D
MMGLEVPERAKYSRVIVSELMRIASHMVGIGIYIMDLELLQHFLSIYPEGKDL